jgi:hypothetical protein
MSRLEVKHSLCWLAKGSVCQMGAKKNLLLQEV